MINRSLKLLWILGAASVALAQEPSATTQSSAQTLALNVEVIEFSTDLTKQIDRIARDRTRLDRLIAEGKVRLIADLWVRAKSGESASARIGQRVPIQVSTQNVSQVQYENTGFNLDITPSLQADNQALVAIRLELSAVSKTSGPTSPTFLQRSFNDRVRVKLDEPVVLLSVVQLGSLWPSASTSQTAESTYGNFALLLTARVER